MRKAELFFEMLRGVYGAAKFNAQWPTDEDRQAALILWGEQIDKLEPDELRSAINHAQRMSTMGDDEWQWPNIGLILSGTRRHLNASHRAFLPAPERKTLTGDELDSKIAQLRGVL